MKLKVLGWAGLLGVLLCNVGIASASGEMGLLLTNPDLKGAPGSVLVLEGVLHNRTDQRLYINGMSSTLSDPFGAAGQYEFFGALIPHVLLAGEVWEGPLLRVTISPQAPIETRGFAISFVGGAHGFAHELLETGYFGVDDSTVVTVVDVPLPEPGAVSRATVHASPNPFGSRIELSIFLPERQDIEVAVYDVAGHHVRHLYAGAADAGLQRYHWDGADDGGRRMSSGIYYVRVRSAARVLKTKVVLTR